MRTIVDLPEEQIKSLDAIGRAGDVSRAELVRRAVDLYLKQENLKKGGGIVGADIRGTVKPGDPNFWGGMDGLEWQRKMRAEWDDRDRMYSNWGLQESGSSEFVHKDKK